MRAKEQQLREAWERVQCFTRAELSDEVGYIPQSSDFWPHDSPVEFWPHWAQRIVHLGQELNQHGLQPLMAGLEASDDAKQYAMRIYKAAMQNDLEEVTALLMNGLAGSASTTTTFRESVAEWVKTGLMKEIQKLRYVEAITAGGGQDGKNGVNVMPILPDRIYDKRPPGWEGVYPVHVDSLLSFKEWLCLIIESKDHLLPMTPAGRAMIDGDSPGLDVRNAYRLITRLGILVEMPQQPTEQMTHRQEVAVFNNLLRECLRLIQSRCSDESAGNEEEGRPAGQAHRQRAL